MKKSPDKKRVETHVQGGDEREMGGGVSRRVRASSCSLSYGLCVGETSHIILDFFRFCSIFITVLYLAEGTVIK